MFNPHSMRAPLLAVNSTQAMHDGITRNSYILSATSSEILNIWHAEILQTRFILLLLECKQF